MGEPGVPEQERRSGDYVDIAAALKQAMNDYTVQDKKNYGDIDVSKAACCERSGKTLRERTSAALNFYNKSVISGNVALLANKAAVRGLF